jgi:THO complex subunit 3
MSMQTDPSNPSVMAAISWTGKFRVFDVRSSSKHTLDVDLKRTSSAMKDFCFLAWSPDSKTIAVNNRADQVFLLNLQTAGSLRLGASKDMGIEVNQMVWGPEGETLWISTGGQPGKIHVYPAPSLKTESSMSVVAHQGATVCIAADPTGKHIATGGQDCVVMLWDPKHLVCTGSFGFATQSVQNMSFNHDGNLLAWCTGGSGTTGGEKNVTIVGANTGQLYSQESTNAPAVCVKWHAKKNVLAYALNIAQLPDERDERRARTRDYAALHIMKVSDRS